MGSTTENLENLNPRLGKFASPKPMVTRRAALGDLCHNRRPQDNADQNPGAVGMKPPQLTKNVTAKMQERTTTETVVSNVAATRKTQKSVVVRQTTTSLKRQESVSTKNIYLATKNTKIGEGSSYSSKQLIDILDVDAKDKGDPFLVTEYIQDIFEYMRSLEADYKIHPGYLTTHRSTPRMRSVVVNWIVEVCGNFKFLLETLHLSVILLDRYLQLNDDIGRDNLQLVGATAMVIAGKYEEMYMPDISEFVYICNNSFTHSEILKMEVDMLCKLKFKIGCPLSIQFLRRFNKIAAVKFDCHSLGKYLLEICLLEYELSDVAPSLQAAAACCLAKAILDQASNPANVWSKVLIHYSSYKYSVVKPVMIQLASHLVKMDKTKYQAVREKYAAEKMGKVSIHPLLHSPLVRKLASEALKKP